MAKLKLPSISKNIAQSVKPMNTMVKSIQSKLKSNKLKVPKIKKVKIGKIPGFKSPKMPNLKMPSFVFKK